MAKIKEIKLDQLTPDDKNFNKGSEFGEALIEKSFQKFGAGRSILLDRNNRIIAGNKSTQKFAETGGQKIIVVETTGDELVAVKRVDIDLDSEMGRELALADNATAKANIVWAEDVLAEEDMIDKAVTWGISFEEEKLGEEDDDDDTPPKSSHGLFPLSIILTKKDYSDWQNFKRSYGIKGDTEAFIKLFNDTTIKP